MQTKLGWLAAVVALSAATACEQAGEAPGGNGATAENQLTQQKIGGPLNREDLLIAAAKAGSAAALGHDDGADQAALDGRPFKVRIRFGCAGGTGAAGGGSAKAGPFNIRFNSGDRTVRVRATPDLTRDNAAAVVSAGADAVEGFWMRRPWLLASGCAAGQSPLATQTASEQRVGIAQAFAVGEQDGRRNGQAYEAERPLNAGEEPSRLGYDLVLTGKLKKLQSGRVIACRMLSADLPPECIVSGRFERVRIETPDGKTIVADWKS